MFEVQYWLENGAQYAVWLKTSDRGEAERVARDLAARRPRNLIKVSQVAA